MTLSQGTRIGPYTLVSAIGSGGMGQVYRAVDTRLDRTVAIKVVAPDLTTNQGRRERFTREARAVAALSHPHICSLHDVGCDDGLDYLVMEYLEGETLADRLLTGPLPLADVIRYAFEIADALDHAHRLGFVHRDVKPANVMLTKSGAKLLDFGVAKSRPQTTFLQSGSLSAPGTDTQNLTAEGTLIGTLHYMAPEQLEGQEADARSDIFAFGAVVYEMATGRKAFSGASPASVIAAILSTDPRPMVNYQPLVPPALDRVVGKCLVREADERWQSAHDLKTTLQWISAAGPSPQPGVPAPMRATRRELLPWIMAGVLLLVSVTATGFAVRANRYVPADAKLIRFLVSPPEDTTLFSGGGVMALSADGHYLAFVAAPRGGKPRLWIRSLDEIGARPLADTTDASQPFWSPDSRFVAFSADGKLKKVDVASGEVQTVCETGGSAGTWSSTGEILFRPNRGPSGIMRVPADGGRATTVTTLDQSRGEFAHNWPWFLPDGRHFLYLIWSTNPDFQGIYVGSLDGSVRTRVLNDLSQALYARPGYIVIRRESNVVAHRFDPVTFKLSGDAHPLAADVAFNPATRRGAFSLSDSGILAYRTTEDTMLGWFERSGSALGTIGLPALDREPALSPDGKTVAITRRDPRSGTNNIWLVESEHGGATRFTFDPEGDSAPIWSPDGARIAFVSSRGGRPELYMKSFKGSSPEEPLLSTPSPIAATDWSRDGRFVVFSTRGDVWALPLVGEHKPFAITETSASENRGRLSADGQWLAYTGSNGAGATIVSRSTRSSAITSTARLTR